MKNFLVFLLCIVCYATSFSQLNQLYCYVISELEKEGLADVKIKVDSYGIETVTDREGKFVIDGKFSNNRLNIEFLKDGYDYLRKKEVKVNSDGSLGTFNLNPSNRQGLWFTIFENAANKTMIGDAQINVNGNEYWTDENGFKFIPINDPKYINGDPILITIGKEGYNDYSQSLIYAPKKRSLEIALTEKVEIILKFNARENSEKGKLLENVEISIDGETYYTNKNGFLMVKMERSGNIVVTASKKKYLDFVLTIENLKTSEVINVLLDKKVNSEKIIKQLDDGIIKVDKFRNKLKTFKKPGG